MLLQCVTEPDPMLSMLEWLCTELMEVEVDQQLGAEKSQRIVSMVVLIVCGVDENGHRDIIAVESMAEESGSSYEVLFQNLEDRSLSTPRLIISDAHAELVSAIRESFPDASWQRCKVHFMRNILVYVPQKEKKS